MQEQDTRFIKSVLYEFSHKDGICCVNPTKIVAMDIEKRTFKEYDEELEEHTGDPVPHYYLRIYMESSFDYISQEFSSWSEALEVYNKLKALRGIYQ